MLKHWLLTKNTHFLNHGSYGATPIEVLNYQQSLKEHLESQPVAFMVRELEGLLDQAKKELAEFIGSEVENLVFVPNATFGVNTVLRSLIFKPGDEILITNHAYNACRNALQFVVNRAGAKMVVVNVPFPVNSPQEIIETILAHISPQTKLALLDHVTSPTALIFPINTLVRELHNRGIDTLVDGAHAPGFIPLDIRSLGVAYYSGNCHKWLCAPKGAGFLYVRPDKQTQIRPLVISNGANAVREERSRFWLEFDWMGTMDPTAYLSVPKAIQFMGKLLPGGWDQLRSQNHQLALQARDIICKALGVTPPCPEQMLGSMASIPLGKISLTAEQLQTQLIEDYQIEVPVIPWGEQELLIRISAQVYNNLEQYQYLAHVLSNLII